jgi:hypothetical protein
MSTKICDPLIGAMAELSHLYPEMRFGQLIEMIAELASEEAVISAADVDDDRFISTASHHMRVRRQQLQIDRGPLQDRALRESRTELLDVLQRIRDRHRDWRFGPLVEHLAALSGSSLYDIEDEQLIAAARTD